MVPVELKAANDSLLTNIKEWNQQRALGSSNNRKTVADVLVLLIALLAQEHVWQWLLDVLEVEDDAIALQEHLVNQVPFQTDLMLLKGLLKLAFEFGIAWHLLIVEFVIDVADVDLVQQLILLAYCQIWIIWKSDCLQFIVVNVWSLRLIGQLAYEYSYFLAWIAS